MVAAIAGVGVCSNCLEKRYDLDDDGVCQYCRGHLQPRSDRPPPPFPTQHLAGTVGRLIVYEWRAERGFDLYHPDDLAEDPLPNRPTNSEWPRFRPLDVTVYRSAG
jgi:hypothetical protein